MTSASLSKRQAAFMEMFDGSRTQREIAKELRVSLSSVTNRFAEMRRLGFDPKCKSHLVNRHQTQDELVLSILGAFWHSGRECFVPQTAQYLDSQVKAYKEIRALMCLKGLIRVVSLKGTRTYEITETGRIHLQSKGTTK